MIDARNKTEYEAAHISNTENFFIGTLKDHLDMISNEKHLVIYCQSDDRAYIAYSILKKYGFENAKIYYVVMKERLEKYNSVTN